MNAILPDSRFRVAWDFIILCLVIVNALVIPIWVVFPQVLGPKFVTFSYIVDLFFWVDIFLNFHTAVYLHGQLVTDKKQISQHYLNGYFRIDLIANTPFDAFAHFFGLVTIGGVNILPWLRLPRLLRLSRLVQYFRNWERNLRTNPTVLRIVQLGLTIGITAHWEACVWLFIAQIEDFGPGTWAGDLGLQTADFTTQYIHSIYWAITTMTTVGYGDITPQTNVEIIFTILVMVLGVSMYAYIIGGLAALITEHDIHLNRFRQKMDNINRYMRHRNIPENLQLRVIGYYDHIWRRCRGVKDKDIFAELPLSIQSEIALFLNKELLAKVPLFKGAEEGFFSTLVLLLEPQSYSPGELIIEAGQIGREMFFIAEGEVEILSSDGKEVYAVHSQGDFFGEIALLFHQKRSARVRAKTFVDVWVLKKEDFDAVLADFPHFASMVLDTARERYGQIPLK